MNRVLVTGASGFIAYHCLSPLVAKGYDVHAVARSVKDGEVANGVHWHRADLLHAEQAQTLIADVRPTHLLHLAWYLEPGAFYKSQGNFEWVQATLLLLRTFREAGGTRCVMAGTAYEYDLRYGYCTEDLTPCNPMTAYGRCKSAMQQLLASYSDTANLSSAWSRLFFLYGPREKSTRLVASVVRALLQGEQAQCSSGDLIRDYMHVQDAADALVEVLGSNFNGTINVASGCPIPIRQVVLHAAQIIGRPDLVHFGAIADGQDSPHLVVANVSRLTNELGWRPRFDLNDGLRDTVNWWSTQLNTAEIN